MQRPFLPTGREPALDNAGVRSLVSEFERRSNSQGAPPRAVDHSPSRQLILANAAAHAAHAAHAGHSAQAQARPRPGTGGANSRAGSRELPVARLGGVPAAVSGVGVPPRRADEVDASHASHVSHASHASHLYQAASAPAAPAASTPMSRPREESPPAGFNFGMSPMPRQQAQQAHPAHQAHPVHHVAPTGRAAGAVSSSPSAQPLVSVQDRIRQFNPQQVQRLIR